MAGAAALAGTGFPIDREATAKALDRLEWGRWVVVETRGYAFAAPIERAILLQEMVTPGQVRRYRERSAAPA
mgnify:CR=1 FL=1